MHGLLLTVCHHACRQVATNKRYAAASGQGFTVSECARSVEADFGKIDIIVHSLANGPEVTKPLLETSRKVCVGHFVLPCHACMHWKVLPSAVLSANGA